MYDITLRKMQKKEIEKQLLFLYSLVHLHRK